MRSYGLTNTPFERVLACAEVSAKQEKIFHHLRDLFGAKCEVLLHDLTSTYFETDTPDAPSRHGCSRDHRPNCPQVVFALVVTPGGLSLAYEVLPGSTADNSTLSAFLQKIEARYGKTSACA